MMKLENDYLSISFNHETGSITSIFDKEKQLEYIQEKQHAVPFRVEIEDKRISEFEDFTQTSLGDEGFAFTWKVQSDLHVSAHVTLSKGKKEVSFTSEVDNRSTHSVISIEYPIIPNLGMITEEGNNDYLAHSFATGFRIHNPSIHFNKDWRGFTYMPYPESFSGSTMQFFSYYGQGKGGLYFAAYDPDSYLKWLNFYKNDHDLLEASFIHACEDIGAHKGMKVEYPIVVSLLDGLDWYEAADKYKRWAHNQYWCQKGKVVDLPNEEKPTWLLEEMGLSTFGINAGADRTKWLEKYHEYIETKMFHILGPDWPNTKQDFHNRFPGGIGDWFPTRFNENNLKAIKAYGDKYAPFEFDYLFNVNGSDGELGKKAMQRIPKSPTKSIDKYVFPILCPTEEFTQKLHVERDVQLLKEKDVDAVYYDISANNVMMNCTDESHQHTIGAGRQIAHAFRDNYINTKQALREEAQGKYVPMGTEMMNEIFLDVLDYYQARAGGQPASMLEGWNIKHLLISGEAELIPMFAYVYHEYGAVRLDGWGKLVNEIGELFYYTVARTYLWGGLYELNYEYSPMEAIDGEENSPEEHYFSFQPKGYEFDPERAKYVGQFANLRTGMGNKYLAYGKMLRPLDFSSNKVKLSWYHYNCGENSPDYDAEGELVVDSIVHSAWQYKNESIGLFFANVSEESQNVTFALDKENIELYNERLHVYQGQTRLDANEDGTFTFSINPRSVIMLEVK